MNEECKRVAIVDDDPAFTHLVKETFRRTGDFEVLAINDPMLAVAELTEFAPDIVLLDVMMPGLDGARLHFLIKRHPDLKAVPVIVLSGLVGGGSHHYPRPIKPGVHQRTLRLGKPIHPLVLKHAVDLELGRMDATNAERGVRYPVEQAIGG